MTITSQHGLQAILSNNGALDETKTQEIVRQIRVFYFNRWQRITGSALSLDDVLAYESSLQPKEEQPERTLTFAELQALIEAGKLDQIPNNKHIPDGLNSEKPTESHATPRKKPWEVASSEPEATV